MFVFADMFCQARLYISGHHCSVEGEILQLFVLPVSLMVILIAHTENSSIFLVSQEVALGAFLQRYRPSVDSFQMIIYLFYLWLNFNCSSADYSMSGEMEG